MVTTGWDVGQDSEPEDSLNSGTFSQVGEEGGGVQFGVREGEWRLQGGVQGRSREWGDQGGSDEMKRREEGGEWGLKSVWEGGRVACSESGYTDDTEDLKQEEDRSKVCCCDAVYGR